MFRRLFDDGIVVQGGMIPSADGQDLENAPAWFAPFDGRGLDPDRRIEISPSGRKILDYGEPVRHGSAFAWMDASQLHLFNIETGEATVFPADERNQTQFDLENVRLISFDGEFALAGSNVVISAKTGKRYASNWDDDRINYMIATRIKIGYRLKDGQLEAIDLQDPNRPPVFLAKVPYPPVFKSEEGIWFWTGSQMKLQKWISPFGQN